ncbi:hypothetical protein Tco_0559946 [Tanacetum coccineum]
MFLGYKVNSKGRKVCPKKRWTLSNLPSPKMTKGRAKDKQKTRKPIAEEAFKQIKQLKAELPMLTAPMEKEELIVYLAAAKETAHPIIVITDQPIQQILSRPEVAGRLQKLESFKLGEYAIHYRPKVSVKGQILVDFIVKIPEDDSLDTPVEEKEELPEPWILFTDGSSCTDGSGARLLLTNRGVNEPSRAEYCQARARLEY